MFFFRACSEMAEIPQRHQLPVATLSTDLWRHIRLHIGRLMSHVESQMPRNGFETQGVSEPERWFDDRRRKTLKIGHERDRPVTKASHLLPTMWALQAGVGSA